MRAVVGLTLFEHSAVDACAVFAAVGSSNQALPVAQVKSWQSTPVYPVLHVHTVPEHVPCPLQSAGGTTMPLGHAELEVLS